VTNSKQLSGIILKPSQLFLGIKTKVVNQNQENTVSKIAFFIIVIMIAIKKH